MCAMQHNGIFFKKKKKKKKVFSYLDEIKFLRGHLS